MEAIAWEPVPRERDERGRALLTSALLHGLFFGLAWLAPPQVPALSLDPELAPLRPSVRVELPAVLAPARASRAGAAEGEGGGALGGVDPGRAPAGARATRRVAHARTADAPDALGALAALSRAFARAPSERSPYVGTRIEGVDRAADLGGDGLDMRGVGRGAGGDGGGTVPLEGMGGSGAGFGATCFVEEVTVHTSEGLRREERGCIAGNLGVGTGTGIGTRAPRQALPDPLPERASAVPHMRCGGPTSCQPIVIGSLGRDVVRRVVRRHLGEVSACYEQALAQRPDLDGRVVLRWTIGPEGRVVGAEVDLGASDLRAPEVQDCVARAARRWTFPSADGVTIVHYPFVLRPAPSAN
ncbi:MAG: AgmX/PglI C-terminal domain-containing protein [Sandaracinus sp.]